MTEYLMLGVLIGMVGLGLLLAATQRTYRQTLQHCADCESAEKLPDGNFYYLVREDRYNELRAAQRTWSKLQRHKFWGAGEPDCPQELKAPNGELHTMRCKLCGDGWRKNRDVCFGPSTSGAGGDHG